jgi:NAD(P)-dependent dehydrogenase (short-subunit alcohol dehydrogenase family)
VQELVDETVRDYGRLDYMFNNAGIGMGGEVRDMDLEHWRRVLEVNLWGVTCGTSAAYEEMVRQGFGHIVNTASLAGLIPLPMVAAYCATKHAVVGLSASLRAEAAALGIKVSVVCPGFVETGIFRSGPQKDHGRTASRAVDPSGRPAQPGGHCLPFHRSPLLVALPAAPGHLDAL